MPDLSPGTVLKADSGAEYQLLEVTGLSPDPATPCDAPNGGSYGPDGGCRCIVCARCGHHAGNSNQGHYWSHCKVLAERLPKGGPPMPLAKFMRLTTREFHFCCPGNCELEEVTP